MKRKTLFILAALALLLAFVVGTLLHTAERTEQAAQQADIHRDALERMYSPSLGPRDAAVVIVEFLDPACETCKNFYPRVKALLAEHPGQIRLVLRYAPFHDGSDKVVAVLEAARKQGKYWPTLEALLAAQAEWTEHHSARLERVWPHLEGLGLNMEQLKTDMAAPEIADLIAQDLADAATLNVSKTPDFFVNGRPLPSFGYRQLRDLVDAALNEAARR